MSWVESAMTKSRCEARRLAAETSSEQSGAGLSASGIPSAVLAIELCQDFGHKMPLLF